jgi:NitT/TauT family transport system substrate-binding protein
MHSTDQGRILIDSHTDTPWHQYLCCMVVTNREFFDRYPVATRRALRALLNGVDAAAKDPAGAANRVYGAGWISPLIYAQRMFDTVPYDTWREYDPEDTLRFYALRLQEAGQIKSTPEEIIENGTDFSHFNELKQEMAMFAAPQRDGTAAAFDCDIEASPRYALRGPRPRPGPRSERRDL